MKTTKIRTVKTDADHQKAVAAGARWMDKHYPNWFKGVVTFVKENRFSITNRYACVLGAGTGRPWVSEEADEIYNFVRRSARLDAGGLTAAAGYEAYWIAAAFVRAGKAYAQA